MTKNPISPLAGRLEGCLEQRNMTAREASLRAGGSADLIRNILTGRSKSPRGDTLSKLAQALGVSELWLLTGEGSQEPTPTAVTQEPQPTLPAGLRTVPDGDMVPVVGTAAGSVISNMEGIDLGGPVDYVPRPQALAHARDLYAVYVTGESMSPMHNPGDLRFVNPHKPPQPGCTVIVQTSAWESDPGQAYIKILERRGGDHITLRQLNPKATIEIPTKFIRSVHRVLTTNELFGV